MIGLIAAGVAGFTTSFLLVDKILEAKNTVSREDQLAIVFSDLGIMDIEKDWIKVVRDEEMKGYHLLEIELSGSITSHNFKNKLLQLQEKFDSPYVKITHENGLLIMKLQKKDFPYEDYHYVECGPTQILIGHDIDYKPVFWNLKNATNLCIAGATGVGKSTVVNTAIINSLKSDLFELDLIDLKKGVEFFNYRNKEGVLHYGETPQEAEEIFKLFFEEFERRSTLLRKGDKQYANLDIYLEENPDANIKRRILIVDEWALLAVTESTKMGKSEKLSPLMNNIAILASQIRFAGMHLLIATQRPSKEIMSGIIKANFNLLGMRVLNEINSKIIIDVEGLEAIEKHTLLGEIDGEWKEVKAYFLDNKETMRLIDDLKEKEKLEEEKLEKKEKEWNEQEADFVESEVIEISRGKEDNDQPVASRKKPKKVSSTNIEEHIIEQVMAEQAASEQAVATSKETKPKKKKKKPVIKEQDVS